MRSARDRLRQLALTGGAKEVIEAIAETCKGNSPGAAKMSKLVMNELIIDPTLASPLRKILFNALIDSGLNETDLAKMAARALKTEYCTMPRDKNSRQYKDSEDFQVAILKYQQAINDRSTLATARALYESSPSEQVRLTARELLTSAGEKTDSKSGQIAQERAGAKAKSRPLPSTLLQAGFPYIALDEE